MLVTTRYHTVPYTTESTMLLVLAYNLVLMFAAVQVYYAITR